MLNPYQPQEAKIEKVITESPNIKTFVLTMKEKMPFAAGQFIELTVPGAGEAPFTPSSSPLELDTMEVTVMNVGRVTNILHNAKAGDTVGIRGPYGQGYPLQKYYNKEVLILGGGVGMAPLRCLLFALLAQAEKFPRIVLCYGAKTPQDILYKELFERWMSMDSLQIHRSVDKADFSWKETEGLVTVLLDKHRTDPQESVAIVCGPPIMMKFGTFKLLELGYKPSDIYLSMEKNMSCGMGKCGHCGIGRFYVCKDGPVFAYDRIKDMHEMWD